MTLIRDMFSRSQRSDQDPITVVIADDEPSFRRALKNTFEKDKRFRVVGEATDGSDAANKVTSLKPDVLILDLAMPNTNGMEAIPEVLKGSPSTKIVIFSNWAPFADMKAKALAAGATLVMDKFTSPRKLIKAVSGLKPR